MGLRLRPARKRCRGETILALIRQRLGAIIDAFLYLVAHSNVEEAKKNWDALHSDPAFPPYRTPL
jgi:hypothetical protein